MSINNHNYTLSSSLIKNVKNNNDDDDNYAINKKNKKKKQLYKSIAFSLIPIIIIFLIVIIPYYLIQHKKHKRNLKLKQQIEKNEILISLDNTIFVCVITMGEKMAYEILVDIFEKAFLPTRIFVGIVQHLPISNSNNYEDILQAYKIYCKQENLLDFSKNIRIITQPLPMAKGPYAARKLCIKKLYKNEKFFLHTSIHNLFVKNWEILAINYLKKCSLIDKTTILCMNPDYLRNILPLSLDNEQSINNDNDNNNNNNNNDNENVLFDKKFMLKNWYSKFKSKLNEGLSKFKIEFDEKMSIRNNKNSKFDYSKNTEFVNVEEREFENKIITQSYEENIIADNSSDNNEKQFYTAMLRGIFLKFKQWSEYGTFETCIQPMQIQPKNIKLPVKTMYYTSRFTFSYSKIILSVIEDERLGFIDLYRVGDMIMNLRLFTFGFNFYNPPTSLCYLNFNYVAKNKISANNCESTILQLKYKQLEEQNNVTLLISYYLNNITYKKLCKTSNNCNSTFTTKFFKYFGDKNSVIDFMNLTQINWKNFTISLQTCKGIYPYTNSIAIRKDILIKYGSIKNYNKFKHIKHIFDLYYNNNVVASSLPTTTYPKQFVDDDFYDYLEYLNYNKISNDNKIETEDYNDEIIIEKNKHLKKSNIEEQQQQSSKPTENLKPNTIINITKSQNSEIFEQEYFLTSSSS